jgi:hypothetical protein
MVPIKYSDVLKASEESCYQQGGIPGVRFEYLSKTGDLQSIWEISSHNLSGMRSLTRQRRGCKRTKSRLQRVCDMAEKNKVDRQ